MLDPIGPRDRTAECVDLEFREAIERAVLDRLQHRVVRLESFQDSYHQDVYPQFSSRPTQRAEPTVAGPIAPILRSALPGRFQGGEL
jgi:hypothetical protein